MIEDDDVRTKRPRMDVVAFSCPRQLLMLIDREADRLMIPRATWLRAAICERLR
jgi:hypothetical protein